MTRRQPYPFLKRDVSRHGQVRWYVQRNGRKIRLPDYPGASKEAEAAYYAALDQRPIEKAAGEGRFAAGSFGHLCGRYLGSPKFLSLAPITQAGYRRHIDALRREFGHIRYADFKRRHIVKIIERKADKPGEANNVLKALQVVFSYAVKADLIDVSPVSGVEKLKVTTDRAGGAEPWTDAHATMFRARWPLGSPQRTLMEIMWSTSLRIGDSLRLGPQHVRDGRIRMTTGKTGEEINLPVLDDLREALDAAPTPHLTYLATAQGRTRSAKAAYSWFSAAARAAGLPPKFTAHGCRKGVLTQAADEGGTEQQLQAIAGHKSTRSVAAYVKKANKARLADDGLGLLERVREGEKANTRGPPSKIVGQNGL